MRQDSVITKKDVPFTERPFFGWMALAGVAVTAVGMVAKPEFRALLPHGSHREFHLVLALLAGMVIGLLSSPLMLMNLSSRIRARQRTATRLLCMNIDASMGVLWLFAAFCLIGLGIHCMKCYQPPCGRPAPRSYCGNAVSCSREFCLLDPQDLVV